MKHDIDSDSDVSGIVASVSDLLRMRPERNNTGFAPGGRVSTHLFGVNHSVFRGHGMEFDESREYQPGDESRRMDWRITARTGTPFTKLYREERERPVHVLVDCRRMMQFGTRVRFKSVMAARLAAMLCWVGIDGNDRVGGVLLSTEKMRYFPARRTRSNMLGFLHAISDATAAHLDDTDDSLAKPLTPEPTLMQGLQTLSKVCRPGTLVFVISDFHDFDAAAEKAMRRLSLRAHVSNLLVSDPLDEQLPVGGDYRISDGEGVLSLGELEKRVRNTHATRFAERHDRLEALCRQYAMAFQSLSTVDHPESALHPHRKHKSARSGARSGVRA